MPKGLISPRSFWDLGVRDVEASQHYALASVLDGMGPGYWTKLGNLWALAVLPFSQPAEKVLAIPAELPPPTSPLPRLFLQKQVFGFSDAESGEWHVCVCVQGNS